MHDESILHWGDYNQGLYYVYRQGLFRQDTILKFAIDICKHLMIYWNRVLLKVRLPLAQISLTIISISDVDIDERLNEIDASLSVDADVEEENAEFDQESFDDVIRQLQNVKFNMTAAVNVEVSTTRISAIFGLLSLKFSSNWSEASFLRLTKFLGSLRHLGSPLPMFTDLPKTFDAFLSAIGLEDPISTFLCRAVCPDEHYIFLDPKISKCPVCQYDVNSPDPYYPRTYPEFLLFLFYAAKKFYFRSVKTILKSILEIMQVFP